MKRPETVIVFLFSKTASSLKSDVKILDYHSPNDNIITLRNSELASTMLNMLSK